MVEMAYGLPYKHEDSTVAINIVDAQLELDLSQALFAKEQERFEMMLILNDERVEYSKGKALELELLLNRIGSVFKPVDDETPDEHCLDLAKVQTQQGVKDGYFFNFGRLIPRIIQLHCR